SGVSKRGDRLRMLAAADKTRAAADRTKSRETTPGPARTRAVHPGEPMKILLVQPAPFEPGRLGLENIIWLSEPVALTSLAAMVSPKHEVRILDMRLES